MNENFRTFSLPIDHLVAEIAAYPIATEASFQLGIVELSHEMDGDTRGLWRRAECELLRSAPSISVDELIGIRDRVWFSNSNSASESPVRLSKYVRNIADGHRDSHGAFSQSGVVELANHLASTRSRQAWRWQKFALPPDLLIGALSTPTSSPNCVEFLSPKLATKLRDSGFAETHMHIGAGIEFPLLWIAVQNYLGSYRAKSDSFASPGAYFDEGKNFAAWLLRGAIARYLMACYLHRSNLNRFDNLTAYLEKSAFWEIAQKMGATAISRVRVALQKLCRGSEIGELEQSTSFGELRDIYSQLTNIGAKPFPDDPDMVRRRDPIASLFPPLGKKGLDSETQLLICGLRYIEGKGKDDIAFRKLFWQSVKLRNLFYRHIVQRPLTPGLQWFIRTYNRIQPGRSLLETRTLIKSATEACGLGRGLKSFEFRTSPGTDVSSLYGWIRDVEKEFVAASEEENPDCEIGIVFHLSKVRGGGFKSGNPKPNWRSTNSDPQFEKNNSGFRYSWFFEQKLVECKTISKLLFSHPSMLRIVRGFDVCTDETAVPTWVIAPLFRHLSKVGQRAAEYLENHNSRAIPPPRFTAHTGEDFVHLLTGLRSIAESIKYFNLNERDRLGHAIALGIPARRWAEKCGRLPVAKETRLFDLTWERHLYVTNACDFQPRRLAFIEEEIKRLATEIFGDLLGDPLADVSKLVADLHDESCLRKVGFPSARIENPENKLLFEYLSCPEVFQRCREIDWVDPTVEWEAIENLQMNLRDTVAGLGLTIEINPTSNLLIGNLGDLTNHPLWRMRSPRNDGQKKLRLCIGSDDPITFATSLIEEYQLLHDAIVLAGLGADEADSWIEHVRQSGLESRFTLPRIQSVPGEFEPACVSLDVGVIEHF